MMVLLIKEMIFVTNKYIDNKVIVIHKEKVGVSLARNLGLDIVKGKYSGFVD